jgi:hypothetical protein
MLSLNKLLYIIFGIIITVTVFSVVLNFLGVDFATYGNYLLWFIALGIFYLVLPSNDDNIFK